MSEQHGLVQSSLSVSYTLQAIGQMRMLANASQPAAELEWPGCYWVSPLPFPPVTPVPLFALAAHLLHVGIGA